jgi:hypothetical protein
MREWETDSKREVDNNNSNAQPACNLVEADKLSRRNPL